MTFFADTFPTSSVTQKPLISYHTLHLGLVGQTCADYIIDLFISAKYFPPTPHSTWQFTLASYIIDIVCASGFDAAVLVHAMTLLYRYKQQEPLEVDCEIDVHRLFLTAFIIASNVIYDKQRKVDPWALVGRGKFTTKELLQTEIEFCQELEWDVQVERQSFMQFAEILNDAAGLEYFDEEITTTPFQYGSTPSVPSALPPMYQEIDQEVEMRMISSLEGILPSPAGSGESLDEEEQFFLSWMVPVVPYRPAYKKRSSVPRAKTSIRRSFKTKMMNVFSRKPRAF